ncbi:hypothetical protein PoB_003033900 [Plakobranchus ocellatus]|uniref:Uncharacterized protein n=1 Tax=Plakobranchus ocellatus TaxID=259542 RepID=A0AAV4ABL9_9GAST|nr:hypothetical protein PoB_003033900 [Plakobranchus ocellatus]
MQNSQRVGGESGPATSHSLATPGAQLSGTHKGGGDIDTATGGASENDTKTAYCSGQNKNTSRGRLCLPSGNNIAPNPRVGSSVASAEPFFGSVSARRSKSSSFHGDRSNRRMSGYGIQRNIMSVSRVVDRLHAMPFPPPPYFQRGRQNGVSDMPRNCAESTGHEHRWFAGDTHPPYIPPNFCFQKQYSFSQKESLNCHRQTQSMSNIGPCGKQNTAPLSGVDHSYPLTYNRANIWNSGDQDQMPSASCDPNEYAGHTRHGLHFDRTKCRASSAHSQEWRPKVSEIPLPKQTRNVQTLPMSTETSNPSRHGSSAISGREMNRRSSLPPSFCSPGRKYHQGFSGNVWKYSDAEHNRGRSRQEQFLGRARYPPTEENAEHCGHTRTGSPDSSDSDQLPPYINDILNSEAQPVNIGLNNQRHSHQSVGMFQRFSKMANAMDKVKHKFCYWDNNTNFMTKSEDRNRARYDPERKNSKSYFDEDQLFFQAKGRLHNKYAARAHHKNRVLTYVIESENSQAQNSDPQEKNRCGANYENVSHASADFTSKTSDATGSSGKGDATQEERSKRPESSLVVKAHPGMEEMQRQMNTFSHPLTTSTSSSATIASITSGAIITSTSSGLISTSTSSDTITSTSLGTAVTSSFSGTIHGQEAVSNIEYTTVGRDATASADKSSFEQSPYSGTPTASPTSLNPNATPFPSNIHQEMQEEIARAQEMDIPVNGRAFDRRAGNSHLNPQAEAFSPTLTDGKGNVFTMTSEKGVCFFRPKPGACSVHSDPRYVIQDDGHHQDTALETNVSMNKDQVMEPTHPAPVEDQCGGIQGPVNYAHNDQCGISEEQQQQVDIEQQSQITQDQYQVQPPNLYQYQGALSEEAYAPEFHHQVLHQSAIPLGSQPYPPMDRAPGSVFPYPLPITSGVNNLACVPTNPNIPFQFPPVQPVGCGPFHRNGPGLAHHVDSSPFADPSLEGHYMPEYPSFEPMAAFNSPAPNLNPLPVICYSPAAGPHSTINSGQGIPVLPSIPVHPPVQGFLPATSNLDGLAYPHHVYHVNSVMSCQNGVPQLPLQPALFHQTPEKCTDGMCERPFEKQLLSLTNQFVKSPRSQDENKMDEIECLQNSKLDKTTYSENDQLNAELADVLPKLVAFKERGNEESLRRAIAALPQQLRPYIELMIRLINALSRHNRRLEPSDLRNVMDLHTKLTSHASPTCIEGLLQQLPEVARHTEATADLENLIRSMEDMKRLDIPVSILGGEFLSATNEDATNDAPAAGIETNNLNRAPQIKENTATSTNDLLKGAHTPRTSVETSHSPDPKPLATCLPEDQLSPVLTTATALSLTSSAVALGARASVSQSHSATPITAASSTPMTAAQTVSVTAASATPVIAAPAVSVTAAAAAATAAPTSVATTWQSTPHPLPRHRSLVREDRDNGRYARSPSLNNVDIGEKLSVFEKMRKKR